MTTVDIKFQKSEVRGKAYMAYIKLATDFVCFLVQFIAVGIDVHQHMCENDRSIQEVDCT